ncbi:MAG: hypothetical protein ACR2P6_02690, partial [Gammaproteobacteria bacterium]
MNSIRWGLLAMWMQLGKYFLVACLAVVMSGCACSKLDADLAKLDKYSQVYAGTVSAEDVEPRAVVL